MKKTVRLTESDLARIVRRVLNEQSMPKIPTELLSCSGVEKAMAIPSCHSVISSLIKQEVPDLAQMGQCTMEVLMKSPEFLTDGITCIKSKIDKNPISY